MSEWRLELKCRKKKGNLILRVPKFDVIFDVYTILKMNSPAST